MNISGSFSAALYYNELKRDQKSIKTSLVKKCGFKICHKSIAVIMATFFALSARHLANKRNRAAHLSF